MAESSYEILFSQRTKDHLGEGTHHDIWVLRPRPEIPEVLSLWQYTAELFQSQSPLETEDLTARSSAKAELPADHKTLQQSQVWGVCNTSWRSIKKHRHQYFRWVCTSLINGFVKTLRKQWHFHKAFLLH